MNKEIHSTYQICDECGNFKKDCMCFDNMDTE